MYWRILQFYRQPKPLHNRTIGRNLHKQIENDIIFDSFIACSIDQSRYRIASKLYFQTDNGIYAVQMYQQICFCFLTIADRDLLGAGQAGTLTNVSFICLSRQCITYQYKYTQLPPLKTLLLSKTFGDLSMANVRRARAAACCCSTTNIHINRTAYDDRQIEMLYNGIKWAFEIYVIYYTK